MTLHSLYTPAVVPFEKSYTLGRNVSAIQILSTDSEEQSRLGLITQLPEGVQVDVRGPGFNDRTVKIRCAGASYYVFLEDLEPQRKRVASAVAG
ncbi:MAG: hypothetical protein M3Y72_17105 [Acidobacteriota bacterium]|nr:hypothetical protein [Acidobacteriota bacterium]